MSEPAQLAKSARELLAGALNALQSNAHVPDELMDLAEPIAEMNISGNQKELWQKLSAIGSDPWLYASVQSPSRTSRACASLK